VILQGNRKMTTDYEKIGRRLAAAVGNLMARAEAELGVTSDAIGGALLQAAIDHALRDMPPMSVAALLRDMADAIEHGGIDDPGNDAALN
jgi:hypothetical protein